MASPLLQHDAQPFSGHRGFVARTRRVVADALDDDAVPVVMTSAARIDAVRSACGARSDEVVGFDLDIAGRNPGRLLPALRKLLDDHPRQRIWCATETVRAGDSAEVICERSLHDLVLRLPAFASWNVRQTCLYDTSALSAEVVAAVESDHANVPADPADRVDRVRAETLPPRPPDSEELGVDRSTLGALRGFVQARAERAGLDAERVDDLVYAVNEVVTNSICHGEGRARVSVWAGAGQVVCEVRDRGWVRDALAGLTVPDAARSSGRGLWLVNQLCDLVQLRSSPAGTAVRLHVDC